MTVMLIVGVGWLMLQVSCCCLFCLWLVSRTVDLVQPEWQVCQFQVCSYSSDLSQRQVSGLTSSVTLQISVDVEHHIPRIQQSDRVDDPVWTWWSFCHRQWLVYHLQLTVLVCVSVELPEVEILWHSLVDRHTHTPAPESIIKRSHELIELTDASKSALTEKEFHTSAEMIQSDRNPFGSLSL